MPAHCFAQKKKALQSFKLQSFILSQSDPVWIRTKDLLLRRQLLYPAELRGRFSKKKGMISHPLCRGGQIRTDDLLLPKQARYRATLHPEKISFQSLFQLTNSFGFVKPYVFKLQLVLLFKAHLFCNSECKDNKNLISSNLLS